MRPGDKAIRAALFLHFFIFSTAARRLGETVIIFLPNLCSNLELISRDETTANLKLLGWVVNDMSSRWLMAFATIIIYVEIIDLLVLHNISGKINIIDVEKDIKTYKSIW